jgi:hypothetical protein
LVVVKTISSKPLAPLGARAAHASATRLAMERGVVVCSAAAPESLGGVEPSRVFVESRDGAFAETTTILPADEAVGTKIPTASVVEEDSSPEKPPTPPTRLTLEQLRAEIDETVGSLPDVLRMCTVRSLAERVAPVFHEADHVRYDLTARLSLRFSKLVTFKNTNPDDRSRLSNPSLARFSFLPRTDPPPSPPSSWSVQERTRRGKRWRLRFGNCDDRPSTGTTPPRVKTKIAATLNPWQPCFALRIV